MQRTGNVPLLGLVAFVAGMAVCTNASAQIPIIIPRVSFSATATFRVPTPGVLVVHDLGREVALVHGAYWLHADGVWLTSHHPHHHWYLVDAPLVPAPLLGVRLRAPLLPLHHSVLRPPGVFPVTVRRRGGPGIAHIKTSGGGPHKVKIKAGPGRSMIKIKGPGGGPGLKIKGPPPGQVKKGGGPGLKGKGPSLGKGKRGPKGGRGKRK